jgi:WD40 repeat protein
MVSLLLRRPVEESKPVSPSPVKAIDLLPELTEARSFFLSRTNSLVDVSTMESNKHSAEVKGIVALPDASVIVSYSVTNSQIKRWDASFGKSVATLVGQDFKISSLALAPDGKNVAIGSKDKSIKLIDLSTGQCLKLLEMHTRKVTALVYLPGGKRILSGSNDCTAILWDIQSSSCIKVFVGHTKGITCVTISSDEKMYATASQDCSIRLWNAVTFECDRILSGANAHQSSVTSVAFSPDNSRLVSGSKDRMVKVWHIDTGECISTLTGHRLDVKAVSWWISAGQVQPRIVSVSLDRTLKIWTIDGKHTSSYCMNDWSLTCMTVTHGEEGIILVGDADGGVHMLSQFTVHVLDDALF